MSLFEAREKENKAKMAGHLVRSVRVVNMLAEMHGIALPYSTQSPAHRVAPSLFCVIYDFGKDRFNLPFIRLHQANTLYLYSRACIFVHHPDVEDERLQELHLTLLNRLRGHILRPISLELRNPIEMLELEADTLTDLKLEEQAR
jgi:hypothetical protein